MLIKTILISALILFSNIIFRIRIIKINLFIIIYFIENHDLAFAILLAICVYGYFALTNEYFATHRTGFLWLWDRVELTRKI